MTTDDHETPGFKVARLEQLQELERRRRSTGAKRRYRFLFDHFFLCKTALHIVLSARWRMIHSDNFLEILAEDRVDRKSLHS